MSSEIVSHRDCRVAATTCKPKESMLLRIAHDVSVLGTLWTMICNKDQGRMSGRTKRQMSNGILDEGKSPNGLLDHFKQIYGNLLL